LRSTVHRVVFPAPTTKEAQTERYSIAYFCHPLDDAVLEEVPSDIVRAHKASGRAVEFEGMAEVGEGKIMTAKQHLMARLEVRMHVWKVDNIMDSTDEKTGNLWRSYMSVIAGRYRFSHIRSRQVFFLIAAIIISHDLLDPSEVDPS